MYRLWMRLASPPTPDELLPRPEWRNGRRSGLKIRRGQPRASSTLASGILPYNDLASASSDTPQGFNIRLCPRCAPCQHLDCASEIPLVHDRIAAEHRIRFSSHRAASRRAVGDPPE